MMIRMQSKTIHASSNVTPRSWLFAECVSFPPTQNQRPASRIAKSNPISVNLKNTFITKRVPRCVAARI